MQWRVNSARESGVWCSRSQRSHTSLVTLLQGDRQISGTLGKDFTLLSLPLSSLPAVFCLLFF